MSEQQIVYRFTSAFINNPSARELIGRRSIAFDGNCQDAIAANKEMIKFGYLVPAAIVECSTHDLFELTNTINHDWTENSQVTVTNPDCRLSSSTMGDVYMDEYGELFMYTMSGVAIM